MKQKLTLLLIALVTSMGAWAETYTVVNGTGTGTSLPSDLGTFSLSGNGYYYTYSSNALSGLTITSDGYLMKEGSSNNDDYGKCFVVSSGPVKTAHISINAPAGYTIAGYTIKGKGGNGGVTFSIKGSDGTTQDLASLTYGGITVSGLCSTTETITITSNTKSKEIWFNTLTVDLVEGTPLSVTYKVRYNNTTVHTSSTVSTCVGTKPLLPTIDTRGYCTYKYYSDEACESEIATLAAENTIVYAKCTVTGAPFEFATDVADANTNHKWEEFKLYNNTNYVYYDGSELAYTATDLSTADGYQWALIGNPYGYKIYNKGAAKYLKASVPTTNSSTTNDFSFDNEGLTFELYRYYSSTDNDHFVSVVAETNKNVSTATVLNYSGGWKIWCGLNNTAGFYCNNGRMNGLSQSFLSPIDVPTTKMVTFEVYVGDDKVDEGTGEVPVGEATVDYVPSSLNRPYVTAFTCDPATQGDATTVRVTFTTALPFKTDGTTYYMSINDGKYIVYDDTNIPYHLSSSKIYGDEAQWTFTGNPYEGYQLKNVQENKYLYCDDSKTGPILSETATDWKIYYRSESTFALYTGTQKYINDNANSGILGYWDNAAGYNSTGSTFVIEEVPDGFASLVTSNITPYYSKAGLYFGATSVSKTALDAAGYVAATSSCNGDKYDQLLAALDINYPATGFYLIKNCNTSRYAAYGTPGQSGKADGLITLVGSSSPANIIRLTKGEGNEYTISAQGLNVQTQTQGNSTFTMTSSAGANFTFTPQGSGFKILNSASDSGNNNPGTLFEASGWTAPYAVVNWEPSGAQGQWIVEDATSVTVTLNSDGADSPTYYATFCAPFSYTVDDGATAYTLAKGSGSYLVATAVDGEVAAGKPVLLKGTSETATLTIGTGYSATPLTDTSLTGTYIGTTITGSSDYIFGKDANNVVGFYHWSGSSLGANRAYLTASAASSVKGFVLMFDDIEDGIKTLSDSPLKGENIYNLAGQRISKMQKGINIVNGKKVLK